MIAVVGGGIAGLAAAYELQRNGTPFILFEARDRLGGTVETTREQGFVLEGGPDGWVTEKPWARELAEELGLGNQLLPSNDAERVTYILRDGVLHTVPDGMRMMVPTDLEALRGSTLFSAEAIAAYEEEVQRAETLRATHTGADESVASFVRRHFGAVVTQTIAAPLLAGVFGGDVEQLSALSVMPQFVAMEREHGSLIVALRERKRKGAASIFTTLRGGVGALVDAIVATLPGDSIRLRTPVRSIARDGAAWLVDGERFDAVVMAAPSHVARMLLAEVDAEAAQLMEMPASSAVLVAFGFIDSFALPRGFGFLVPPGTEGCDLLAATFVDQKFDGRVPQGGRLLRAFFGGAAGEQMQDAADGFVAAVARAQLSEVLRVALPEPVVTTVRRWPMSLPQYTVGHSERMRRLAERVALLPGLKLVGNAYNGVGLPDLVRDARAAVRSLL